MHKKTDAVFVQRQFFYLTRLYPKLKTNILEYAKRVYNPKPNKNPVITLRKLVLS